MFRSVTTLGYSPREEHIRHSYSPFCTVIHRSWTVIPVLNLDTGPPDVPFLLKTVIKWTESED